jgi:hypothetical protein
MNEKDKEKIKELDRQIKLFMKVIKYNCDAMVEVVNQEDIR